MMAMQGLGGSRHKVPCRGVEKNSNTMSECTNMMRNIFNELHLLFRRQLRSLSAEPISATHTKAAQAGVGTMPDRTGTELQYKCNTERWSVLEVHV